MNKSKRATSTFSNNFKMARRKLLHVFKEVKTVEASVVEACVQEWVASASTFEEMQHIEHYHYKCRDNALRRIVRYWIYSEDLDRQFLQVAMTTREALYRLEDTGSGDYIQAMFEKAIVLAKGYEDLFEVYRTDVFGYSFVEQGILKKWLELYNDESDFVDAIQVEVEGASWILVKGTTSATAFKLSHNEKEDPIAHYLRSSRE